MIDMTGTTGGIHLERLATGVRAAGLDADTTTALLALEAATQERPLGVDALLRETAADGVVLLARAGGPDGRLEGLASARLLVDEAHVIRLAVDAQRRRQGIGRLLLDGLVGWAREVKAEALVLEVRASNAAALGLYAEAGLQVDGRRPRYYADGEDALLLRRSVGRS
jgi:ribosomal-protein-alanine N-acetyltransferase